MRSVIVDIFHLNFTSVLPTLLYRRDYKPKVIKEGSYDAPWYLQGSRYVKNFPTVIWRHYNVEMIRMTLFCLLLLKYH